MLQGELQTGECPRSQHGSRLVDLREPGVAGIELPHRVAHVLEKSAPVVESSRRGGIGLEHSVEHQVEQFGLSRHVAVQRHGADPEGFREPPHGDGLEPIGIGDLDGRHDDVVQRQLGLGAAVAPIVPLPQQGEAAVDVPATAVLDRHARLVNVLACRTAYGVLYICVQRTQFSEGTRC